MLSEEYFSSDIPPGSFVIIFPAAKSLKVAVFTFLTIMLRLKFVATDY
jgi:hypothetical protein